MGNRIKVLQTIRQGTIGGGERHVIDLVEGIDKEKFEPIVLSFTDGEMIDHLNEIGIENHVIHTQKGFDINAWPKVNKLIQDRGISVVHAHGTRACSNSFYSAAKAKVPCIYTVHGWSFHDDQKGVQKTVRSLSEQILVGKVDATVFVSEYNQEVGVSKFSPKDHYLIKNGVNLNRFSTDVSSTIREEFDVPDDCVLVGYIARLTKQKDPFTMIKAMAEIKGQAKKIKLLMVGSGELDFLVDTMIQDLGLEDVIIRVPFRTDIPEILKAIDIYCLPSLWEGLPIGILEAMAMSKPVIATSIGGNTELVEYGVNGYLFPVGDEHKLATKILRLYTHASERIKFGKLSRKLIEGRYSIEIMVRKIEKLYDTILDQ